MAQRALGEIKPNSTTVAPPATQNEADPTAVLHCQALQFQALAANTNSVFICDRALPSLTANVLAEIPAPSSSPATRPAWTIANPASANAFNAASFYILPAVSGEGVRVTIVRT